MKVLIKRDVKDRGRAEALPEDFHADEDSSGQPKATEETLLSDSFSFFLFHMVGLR